MNFKPVTYAEIDQVFTAHFKMLKLWREYRCVPNRMSEAVRYYVWLHLERTEANAKQDAKVDLWIRDPIKQIYESQGDVLLFRDGSVLTLDQIYDDKDAYLQDILSDSEHEKLVRAERAAKASASDLAPTLARVTQVLEDIAALHERDCDLLHERLAGILLDLGDQLRRIAGTLGRR